MGKLDYAQIRAALKKNAEDKTKAPVRRQEPTERFHIEPIPRNGKRTLEGMYDVRGGRGGQVPTPQGPVGGINKSRNGKQRAAVPTAPAPKADGGEAKIIVSHCSGPKGWRWQIMVAVSPLRKA
ncbi:hypothetical protein BDV95DRAFT_602200 [Massariosphaeria phaeospora]|uniref:Uncharacterized protein n=1 Tax=Massariosphaeria phaeospora TaxID=100035 RepID=A0A7C8MSW8_9PLEO|nr:hypothetical protein BDV95DRAFT_602200 [Massariosphaeria phaeospora]